MRDLKVLWETRNSSGFPWPFQGVFGIGGGWRMVLTGRTKYSVVPFWWQIVTIPLRPWRYAKMVREIARVRNRDFSPSRYDDVP